MKSIPVNDFATFERLYEESYQRIKSDPYDEKTNIIFLFIASIDPDTKKSWCPDCVEIKPIIDRILDDFKFNEHLEIATVQVGNKEEWKSADNPYRLHELALTNVPTLVSLRTKERLVENECSDPQKVIHLFSNSI